MLAEPGIEGDRSFEQESRHCLVMEEAGTHERLVNQRDHRRIVAVLVERSANSIEIATCRNKLQRARQQAFPVKQFEQSSRARLKNAVADRWRHDCPGVDQQLCARTAREPCFPLRVAGIAISPRRHSEQTAAFLVPSPRKERRVFGQQWLQAFGVVVVNEALGLGDGPFESRSHALADLGDEVLPARVAVLTRECELGAAQRERSISRERLGLFTEGF